MLEAMNFLRIRGFQAAAQDTINAQHRVRPFQRLDLGRMWLMLSMLRYPSRENTWPEHSFRRRRLRREKLLQLRIDEIDILRIGAGAAGEMAPDRRNGHKSGVRHMRNLELAIFRWKIQIGLARHDIGSGLDGAERRLEVAVVEFVVADVAILPGPEHGQQVVWILRQKKPFPERHQKILKRGKAQRLEIQFLAIERLRKAPAGIDPRRRAQPPLRLLGVPAFLPCRVSGQRGLDGLQENEAVTRAFRRTP